MTKIILIILNLFPVWLLWLFLSAVFYGYKIYPINEIINGYYWWWC